jgi:hypothetical protein
VFPEPKYNDFYLKQLSVSLAVSALVPFDFCFPEWPIDTWDMSAGLAPMPKAPVEEYGHPAFREVEIRFPLDLLVAHLPPTDASPHQHGTKARLGRSVSASFDCAHPFRMGRGDVAETAADQFFTESAFHQIPSS